MAFTGHKPPRTLEGSGVKCKLPLVAEYNTSIARFRNQIMAQVLMDLQRYLVVEPPQPLPPVTPIPTPTPTPSTQKQEVILSETTHSILLSTSIGLSDSPAVGVDSVNVALQNAIFEIIGFSSIEARVTGEAVYQIDYLGTDGQNHNQQMVVPVSQNITIPGDFPTDAVLSGELEIDRIVNTYEFDAGFTQINSIVSNLEISAVIRVTALVESPSANQLVLLSSTSNSMTLAVEANFAAVYGQTIIATNVALRNVFFERVGLASSQVRVTGEAVLKVNYLGIDHIQHIAEGSTDVAAVYTIPGNFPVDALVDGSLVIDNTVTIPEEDPSMLAITGVTGNLFLTAVINVSVTT